MFGDNKNLTDASTILRTDLEMVSFTGSYTKTNKLITALYMVTDIIDKDEPLRHKLRTLGVSIISDMYTAPSSVCVKIAELMSFLNIASTINIISGMNSNILLKEFIQLDQSIKESKEAIGNFNRQVNLTEFLKEEEVKPPLFSKHFPTNSGRGNYKGHESIGHSNSTRIGVQKGSTLMQALSDNLADIGRRRPTSDRVARLQAFEMLKKQRRNDIISIIKNNGGSATITDIKTKIDIGRIDSFASSSEKTLQRELVSMAKDGVLNKTGEKRWSRYSLVS